MRVRQKETVLIESAIQLFAEEGFWQVSTTKIAEHANVGTGTLYNYFKNKNEVIDKVYTYIRQDWHDFVMDGSDPNASLYACFEHAWLRNIQWGVNNPDRYKLVGQLRINRAVSHDAIVDLEEDLDVVLDLYERGVASGELHPMDPQYFLKFYLASAGVALSYAVSQQMRDMQLIRHVQSSFEIYWRAIAVAK